MKKKMLVGIVSLALILAAVPVLAAKGGGKGFHSPEDQAKFQAIREEGKKFRAETLELRQQLSLKRAELKVLVLKPGTTEEDLLAKNRELHGVANKLSDMRLLHRFEMAQKYPELAADRDRKRGLGRRGHRVSDREKQGRQGRHERRGWFRDDETKAKAAQIREELRKHFQETAGLRQDLRLKGAEMRVLFLTPGTTSEALLAKNKEIHDLTDRLGDKRLLRRFEMTKKYPELAGWWERNRRGRGRF